MSFKDFIKNEKYKSIKKGYCLISLYLCIIQPILLKRQFIN